MKLKLVSAFATGAALASVIVYFAVRPVANVEEPKPEEPQRVASIQKVAPVPAPPPAPAPVPPPKHNHPPTPVREKPSPFRSPVAQTKPVAPPPPAPVPVQNVSLPAPKPAPRVAPSVTLAAGTLLPVRIGESLSPARNQPGDIFFATLTQPLVVDGWVIAETGAHVRGRVIDKDAAHLRISIVWFATSDGQSIPVHTEPHIKLAPAEIPVESRIIFKVLDSITITERLD